MLEKKKKDRIIKKYKMHDSDTGSSPVQIAILTEEIKELTSHLKTHKKDFSSRRGLLRKVSERRKLLAYLRREDEEIFEKIVKDLKIKVVLPEKHEEVAEERDAEAEKVEQDEDATEDETNKEAA